MDILTIKAVNRDSVQTSPNKVRSEGLLPAVMYGHNVPNQHLAVNAIEFEKLFRKAGESTIVNLELADGKTQPVLIHDVQYHFLKNHPQHVDFLAVSMTEKLRANIPLEFVGEPPAVKALGGTLVKVMDAIEVECLPGDLPHSLSVDISKLKTFEDQITIKDIVVGSKVEVLAEADEVVAMVQAPRDVEAELAQPVEFDVTKVEGVVKPEAEAEGEAAAEPAKE